MVSVTSIDEARRIAVNYGAVITAGPKAADAAFGHPNQRVRTFADTTSGPYAPTLKAVAALVEFGATHIDSLLIHCHRGESRSTAVAIGVAVASGLTVPAACDVVRLWSTAATIKPNPLIVQHVEAHLSMPGLAAMVAKAFPSVAGHLGAATTRAW